MICDRLLALTTAHYPECQHKKIKNKTYLEMINTAQQADIELLRLACEWIIKENQRNTSGCMPNTSDELCLKPEAEELFLAGDKVLNGTRERKNKDFFLEWKYD